MDKNHPKFDQFPVSQLPAATHYGFHNDFADIVAPLEASFPNLTPLLQAYRAALQVESRIYVRPRGLDSTRKLLEADLRRGGIITLHELRLISRRPRGGKSSRRRRGLRARSACQTTQSGCVGRLRASLCAMHGCRCTSRRNCGPSCGAASR